MILLQKYLSSFDSRGPHFLFALGPFVTKLRHWIQLKINLLFSLSEDYIQLKYKKNFF